MSIRRPSEIEIAAAATRVHLTLDPGDIAEFAEIVDDTMESLHGPLDLVPDYLPEPKYPRLPGHRPDSAEDPLSAWYVKSRIKGAKSGPRHGRTARSRMRSRSLACR
jgi:amidase